MGNSLSPLAPLARLLEFLDGLEAARLSDDLKHVSALLASACRVENASSRLAPTRCTGPDPQRNVRRL